MKYEAGTNNERRKRKRFPVLRDLDIPVSLQIPGKDDVPAILLNLSASGIGLIVFSQLAKQTRIKLTLQLNHLTVANLKARIVWSKEHKGTYRLGIEFLRIVKKLADAINKIAGDFTDCEIRITLGVQEICFTECQYYNYCGKKYKI